MARRRDRHERPGHHGDKADGHKGKESTASTGDTPPPPPRGARPHSLGDHLQQPERRDERWPASAGLGTWWGADGTPRRFAWGAEGAKAAVALFVPTAATQRGRQSLPTREPRQQQVAFWCVSGCSGGMKEKHNRISAALERCVQPLPRRLRSDAFESRRLGMGNGDSLVLGMSLLIGVHATCIHRGTARGPNTARRGGQYACLCCGRTSHSSAVLSCMVADAETLNLIPICYFNR